jgi:predicted phage-related endonuclease
LKKATTTSASKKLSGVNRKTHKNETNLGLKKQEMSSKGVGAKKSLNGKWEPVMNKIAETKNVKKRFDNVKSKVTCGVVKKNLSVMKSSPSEELGGQSTESTGASATARENSAGNKR